MTAHRVAVVVLLAAWAWCAWQAATVDAWGLTVLCVACAAVTAVAGWPTGPTESSLEVEARLAATPAPDVSEPPSTGSASADPGRDSAARPGSPISPTTTQEP